LDELLLKDELYFYQLLDLKPGATFGEVKQAYRDMVKVWHPDRFAHDQRLQLIAQEKLKEINIAYEHINLTQLQNSSIPSSNPVNEANPYSETVTNQNSPDEQNRTGKKTMDWKPIIFVGSLILIVFFINITSSDNSPNQKHQNSTIKKDMESTKSSLSLSKSKPNISSNTSNSSDSPSSISVPASSNNFYSRNLLQKNLFTLGSTKKEVVSIQGKPDKETETEFKYGASKVVFLNDKVVNWNNRFPRLKVGLEPKNKYSVKNISNGLTKEEVLSVYGTPDNLSEDVFYYLTSAVYFKNGIVVGWEGKHINKKVKKESNSFSQKNYFTVGSTKDEVLSIQGTPDRFSENKFYYGTSDVYFENDLVVRWYDSYPKLKVEMKPKFFSSKKYFTVGSTKDEVLSIQGTPDRFSENKFYYGTSDVYFENDLVVRWYDSYPKLKVEMKP
jgi:curved DNA-binding protein CbpA